MRIYRDDIYVVFENLTKVKGSTLNVKILDSSIRISSEGSKILTRPFDFFRDFENFEFADAKQLENYLNSIKSETLLLISDDERVRSVERKIVHMSNLAIAHPLLDNVDMASYQLSIDGYFNTWKRTGLSDILVDKILLDSSLVTHPQHVFLNTVVNEEGNKTFEFLISTIRS